jgi:hypothetical protein
MRNCPSRRPAAGGQKGAALAARLLVGGRVAAKAGARLSRSVWQIPPEGGRGDPCQPYWHTPWVHSRASPSSICPLSSLSRLAPSPAHPNPNPPLPARAQTHNTEPRPTLPTLQVCGVKRMLLWPASALPTMRPYPDDHPLARRLRVRVDGEAPPVRRLYARSTHSQAFKLEASLGLLSSSLSPLGPPASPHLGMATCL